MDEMKEQYEIEGQHKPVIILPYKDIHKDILDLPVNIKTTSCNGRETEQTGLIKERVSEDAYRVEVPNGKQRIIEYQELVNLLNEDDEEDVERWTFESIKAHRWSKDKKRKGKIDILLSWEGYEEETWEPMEVILKDDPVFVAKYAHDNNLTNKPLWKWAKRYTKNIKKLKKMVRNMLAAKRKSRGVKYQFGVRVPRNIVEAYLLDSKNGNTLRSDAIEKELTLLRDDFECFRVGNESEITEEHQKIPLLWTFGVKVR